MRMATHVYDRRHDGVTQMVDPLDAAALEDFCLHARALVEFLWRDRKHNRVSRRDAVAGDWFDTGSWRYEPVLPPEIKDLRRRTGFALAHIPTTGSTRLRRGAGITSQSPTASHPASHPLSRTCLIVASTRASNMRPQRRTSRSGPTWPTKSRAFSRLRHSRSARLCTRMSGSPTLAPRAWPRAAFRPRPEPDPRAHRVRRGSEAEPARQRGKEKAPRLRGFF
jgi:hypothetical protein